MAYTTCGKTQLHAATATGARTMTSWTSNAVTHPLCLSLSFPLALHIRHVSPRLTDPVNRDLLYTSASAGRVFSENSSCGSSLQCSGSQRGLRLLEYSSTTPVISALTLTMLENNCRLASLNQKLKYWEPKCHLLPSLYLVPL